VGALIPCDIITSTARHRAIRVRKVCSSNTTNREDSHGLAREIRSPSRPPGATQVSELTALFDAVGGGDRSAIDRLLALMYGELHQLAHRRLTSSRHAVTLETTGLVHESYLRFLTAGRLRVTDRAHFLAYAARVMRSIIVDFARKHRATRHGGGALHVTLNTNVADDLFASEEQIIRVNEALEELAQADPRLVQVVDMRYFGGLSEGEIAEVLELTERTVRRDWQKARLLLRAALE
jgi:RNA polymerase sigma factor (TIGR02999 family)